jgi:predicted amidophosphoribosyltransferase
MMSAIDDFFGDAGKCANCGAECDPDAELCPACRAEAERKQRQQQEQPKQQEPKK